MAKVAGPATAAAVESFHPLINDENAPIIRVSRRTVQSARARLNERTQSNNGGWMQLNRRIPSNAVDTSYGGDWPPPRATELGAAFLPSPITMQARPTSRRLL